MVHQGHTETYDCANEVVLVEPLIKANVCLRLTKYELNSLLGALRLGDNTPFRK